MPSSLNSCTLFRKSERRKKFDWIIQFILISFFINLQPSTFSLLKWFGFVQIEDLTCSVWPSSIRKIQGVWISFPVIPPVTRLKIFRSPSCAFIKNRLNESSHSLSIRSIFRCLQFFANMISLKNKLNRKKNTTCPVWKEYMSIL